MTGKQMVKLLEQHGWVVVRVRVSHHQLEHATRPELVTEPVHGKYELGPGLPAKIMKDAGLK